LRATSAGTDGDCAAAMRKGVENSEVTQAAR
jgi:hypothetical protein